MGRLSEGDYRGALAFLHEAHQVDGPEAFPERLRGSLASLLRADTLWHCRVRDSGDSQSTVTVRAGRLAPAWAWGEGAVAGGFSPAILDALRDYPEADLIPATPPFVNRPVRRSDLVSAREWRKTGRWVNADRPVGAKDWVRLWIGSPRRPLAVFEADNCRREWDGRVVAMLELLAPHLGLLFQRAALRVSAHSRTSGLTPRELEILWLVGEGRTNAELARILWISPHTVRKHLENAFDKLGVHTRTAAVACAFRRPGSAA